ncbi:MAG: hypothetical protein RTU63_14655 [Candidatus Thorarchaeota archaeon]
MTERNSEETIILLKISDDSTVCPFTQPQGKNIGNALLALMFIVVPFMLLIYFVSMQM